MGEKCGVSRVVWPPLLQQLSFGVVWPASLEQLSFGSWFNQPHHRRSCLAGLSEEAVLFGDRSWGSHLFQSIDGVVVWLASLRSVTRSGDCLL